MAESIDEMFRRIQDYEANYHPDKPVSRIGGSSLKPEFWSREAADAVAKKNKAYFDATGQTARHEHYERTGEILPAESFIGNGTSPTSVGTGNIPTTGYFRPAQPVNQPTSQPAAAAPQQVTGHAASPWGASISDFFNNDNWTRQYEGTNPRTGEPMSVGNWYTPGGGDDGSSDINSGRTDFRFTNGRNTPYKEVEDYDWSTGTQRVTPGVPNETATTPPVPESWWDQGLELARGGVDSARGAIDDFTAWDDSPEGKAWTRKFADTTNVHDQLVRGQDAIRKRTDSAAEGDGFGAWIADKYNNVDDFSRFLKSQAENVRIPVPGSENLKFDNTEKAMMKSIPGGGAPYAVMKYIYGLGGDSFNKLRGYWD